MSCLPYLVSISLYHSGAKKQLYKRLNKMGLSMSHRMTLIKVGQLAEQCEKDVCKWKSDVEENSERHEVPYQITGDNLHLQIQTKVMSLSRQNKSLHWFNMVATQERVQSPVFADQEPRPSIMALSPKKFLPSNSDDEHLRKEFTVLVTRVLCHNLQGLFQLRNCVVDHIPHEHMKESANKSVQVPLGVTELNENKQKDMIDIMHQINSKYVPHHQESLGSHNPVIRVLFGGDQLTVERARGAQKAVLDGNTQNRQFDSTD